MKIRIPLLLTLVCPFFTEAQTVNELYNLRRDGEQPLGRLLLDGGSYYGTTFFGGSSLKSDGVVFKLTPGATANDPNVQTILLHGENGGVGSNPDGGVIRSTNGNLYFSFKFGGAGSLNGVGGTGTFYKLSPGGVATRVSSSGGKINQPLGEMVEHTEGVFLVQGETQTSNFDTAFVRLKESPFEFASIRDGNKFTEGKPFAALLRGLDGKYYGGTEYRLLSFDPGATTPFASTVIRTPSGSTDANGNGYGWGVTQGADGTLYGVGELGGTNGAGVVWKMNTDGTGYTVLHHFAGGVGGSKPRCRLVLHADGKLYGTTFQGGTSDLGIVFSVAMDGTFTKLLDFNGTNGSRPRSLVAGRSGTLAGITQFGGKGDKGTIFEIATDGTLSTLHSFGGTGGYIPSGPLLLASDGNFYGCSAWGGKGNGAIFRLVPGATPRLEEVYAFGTDEGKNPAYGLTEGFDGALYGCTDGNVSGFTGNNNVAFRVMKDGSQFSVIRSFSQTSNAPDRGQTSRSRLVMRTDGSLIGVGDGNAFRITADGKSFPFANLSSSNSRGERPVAEPDGSMLLVTATSDTTSIFRIARNGTVSTEKTDNTVVPATPAIRGADGAFYFLDVRTSSAPVLVRLPVTGSSQRITLSGDISLLDTSTNLSALAEREPGVFYLVRQNFGTTFAEMPQRLVKIVAATGVVTNLADLGNAPQIYERANFTQFVGGFFGAPSPGGFLVVPSIELGRNDNLLVTLPQDVLQRGGRLLEVSLPARTGTAPLATTGAATGVALSTASLAGEVNPNGTQTYAWIEFGFSTAYGLRGGITDAGSGSAPVAVTAALAGLRGGQTYHYRTVASSAAGIVYGASQTFTTQPNQTPVANNDTATVRLVQPYQPVSFSILANDTDADNDTLSVVTTTDPRRGTFQINGGQITYTPNNSGQNVFNAQGDTFSYLISDGRGGEAAGIVTIVGGANSAPVANGDTVFIRGKETVSITPLLNDTDADNDTLEIQSFSQAGLGFVTKTDATLKYTPGKTFNGTDSFTYTVRDGFGGQATGTVSIINPFVPLAGSYSPVVGLGDGLITLKVTSGGLLSGKLKLGTKTLPLKGLIGFDGVFTQTIKRKGLPDLVVTLNFTNPGQIPTVSGTVAGGPTEQFPVSADSRLATTLPASAPAGKYTLILEPGAGIPAALDAFGWAVGTLSPKGSMVMIGQTPDGKPLSLSAKMRVDASVVIFKTAPAHGSSFFGEFAFADAAQSDFSGSMKWTRAAVTKGSIFTGAIDATLGIKGCKFTPPAKNVRTLGYTNSSAATGQILLEDGELAASITRTLAISTTDKATLAPNETSPEVLKISLISRGDGRFEGTFKHPVLPKNPTIKFRGVQQQTVVGGTGPNKAFGLFTTPADAGSFTFTPQ